ncbi:MAG: outer membrane beta-barrel protein [Balneolaceae bacterium]
MTKLTKILLSVIIIPVLLCLFPKNGYSQWSVWGSFELQDEDPTDGFGIRVEREMVEVIPLIDIRLRAQASRMSEDNRISQSGVMFDQDLTMYDFGLSAMGGFTTGVLRIYTGFGGGYMNFESEARNIEIIEGAEITVIPDIDRSSFFWNFIAGFEFTPIPLVNPFFEYRFINVTDNDEFAFRNLNRLSIGFSLNF